MSKIQFNFKVIIRIIEQAAKEFFVPLIIAVSLTYLSLRNVRGEIDNYVNFLTSLGANFFLVCWFFGQIFRIAKQIRVEDQFGKLENRLADIIANFERDVNKIVGSVTGGDSYAFIVLISINNELNLGQWVVVHHGNFPLYDVQVRVFDASKFKKLGVERFHECNTMFNVGNITPGYGLNIPGNWQIGDAISQDYSVFVTAKNGQITEEVKLRKVDGVWHSAIRVKGLEFKAEYEQVTDAFPRQADGTVDWDN